MRGRAQQGAGSAFESPYHVATSVITSRPVWTGVRDRRCTGRAPSTSAVTSCSRFHDGPIPDDVARICKRCVRNRCRTVDAVARDVAASLSRRRLRWRSDDPHSTCSDEIDDPALRLQQEGEQTLGVRPLLASIDCDDVVAPRLSIQALPDAGRHSRSRYCGSQTRPLSRRSGTPARRNEAIELRRMTTRTTPFHADEPVARRSWPSSHGRVELPSRSCAESRLSWNSPAPYSETPSSGYSARPRRSGSTSRATTSPSADLAPPVTHSRPPSVARRAAPPPREAHVWASASSASAVGDVDRLGRGGLEVPTEVEVPAVLLDLGVVDQADLNAALAVRVLAGVVGRPRWRRCRRRSSGSGSGPW